MTDRAKAFSFDTQAALYDRIRPHYPDALFQTLCDITQLKPGAKLLEIGPGTGQATEPMVRRGFDVTGVEPGSHLAATLRRKFEGNPLVHVANSTFEEAELPASAFDLVYSATAFHWISTEARFAKTHQILKPGGYLAVIHTNHVSDGEGDVYFHASRKIHELYTPEEARKVTHMQRAADLRPPHFDPQYFDLKLFTYMPVVIRYSAAEYADLQHTYSPTLSLPPHVQQEYLAALRRLIDAEFGGYIDKHFAMSLAIAKAL